MYFFLFSDFPPLGVRSAKTENVKKLLNFGEQFWGRPDYPSKSAPSTGKLHFRVFRPGPEFLQVPKAKPGQNTTESPFPAGDSLVIHRPATFWEKFLGQTYFFPKVHPGAPGNCVILFLAQNFSKCQWGCPKPKGPRNPVFCNFPPVGVQSAKTQNVKKLRNFGEKFLGWTDFSPQKCP